MDFSPDCLNTGCTFFLFIRIINYFIISGETDQKDEKLETADVVRRSSAETVLDLPTESHGNIIISIISFKQSNNFIAEYI